MLNFKNIITDNKYSDVELEFINAGIIVTMSEYIIGQMLNGFRKAGINDPNIKNSVAAQLQFIRITVCNKYYDMLLQKYNTRATEILNSYSSIEEKEKLNTLLANETEILILNTDEFVNAINNMSEIIVDDLNNFDDIKELNKLATDKVFRSPVFEYIKKEDNNGKN